MALELPPGTDLTKVPAGMPPPGEVPDLINPPSLRPATLGIATTLMVLGTAFAASSIYDHRRRLKAADWTLITAVVFCISYTVLVFTLAHTFVHQWDLPLSVLLSPAQIKKQFAQNMLIAPSTFFPKAAILLLYLHLFGINRKLRWSVWAAMALNVIAYLPQWAITPPLCAAHVGEEWTVNVSIRCAKEIPWGVTQSALGLLLDLMLFIIPIPIVLNLSMSSKRKLGVLSVFGTAVLGIVASIVSLVYRIRLLHSTNSDTEWYASVVELCVLVEIWIGVMVASMPGFASSFKLLVIESGAFSTLASRITGLLRSGGSPASQRSRRTDHSSGIRQQHHTTAGSSSESYERLGERVELGDLKSKGSLHSLRHGGRDVPPMPQDRIAKTVTIDQESERTGPEAV